MDCSGVHASRGPWRYLSHQLLNLGGPLEVQWPQAQGHIFHGRPQRSVVSIWQTWPGRNTLNTSLFKGQGKTKSPPRRHSSYFHISLPLSLIYCLSRSHSLSFIGGTVDWPQCTTPSPVLSSFFFSPFSLSLSHSLILPSVSFCLCSVCSSVLP